MGLLLLQAGDDLAQAAGFGVVVAAHLLHAVAHVKDGFDARKVDAEVFDEAADVGDTLDVCWGVEAWAARARAFASGCDEAEALVVAECLLVDASQVRRLGHVVAEDVLRGV